MAHSGQGLRFVHESVIPDGLQIGRWVPPRQPVWTRSDCGLGVTESLRVHCQWQMGRCQCALAQSRTLVKGSITNAAMKDSRFDHEGP
jgi:hypothetical protein